MLKPSAQQLFQPAVSQAADDLEAGVALHHGGAQLRRHMKNARKREGRYGMSIGKEHRSSSRKVDLAVAFVGARMLYRLVSLKTTRSSGKGRLMLLPD
jgi:phage terminase large subunit-like protein